MLSMSRHASDKAAAQLERFAGVVELLQQVVRFAFGAARV
jgi:hypothetical protein